jgi:hypothetical protein
MRRDSGAAMSPGTDLKDGELGLSSAATGTIVSTLTNRANATAPLQRARVIDASSPSTGAVASYSHRKFDSVKAHLARDCRRGD